MVDIGQRGYINKIQIVIYDSKLIVLKTTSFYYIQKSLEVKTRTGHRPSDNEEISKILKSH